MVKRLLPVLAVLLSCWMMPSMAEGPAVAEQYGSSLGLESGPRQLPTELSTLVPQVDISGQPMRGEQTAPVTIVEFTDYECPYCQAFAAESWPQLETDYVNTGRVRYVVRNFPLQSHPQARPAATAVACAAEQERFWEMHDALFAAPGQLRDQDLEGHARRLGLDMDLFAACRLEDRHEARLDADVAAARRAGARGTPSFLVGASTGSVVRGRLLQGLSDYAALEKLLLDYLAVQDDESPLR